MMDEQKQSETITNPLEDTETSSTETPESLKDGKSEAETAASVNLEGEEASATTASDESEEIMGSWGDTQAGELMLAIETLQQENALLRQQLDEQKSQNEVLKNQYIRNAADFENFRKRTSQQQEELEHQVKRNTITELLPAIDNFERARLQIKPNTDGEMAIHKSYQGVYKQIVDALKRIGVSPMRPEGQPFDPNYHEAVFREPTNDHPEDTVIEQLVRGYLLGDRVLRHAMVKVAAPKDDEDSTSESETTSENPEASNSQAAGSEQ